MGTSPVFFIDEEKNDKKNWFLYDNRYGDDWMDG